MKNKPLEILMDYLANGHIPTNQEISDKIEEENKNNQSKE